MDAVLVKWVIVAASIMLLAGIVCVTIMVVVAFRSRSGGPLAPSEESKSEPARNIIMRSGVADRLATVSIVSYVIVLLAITSSLSEGALTLLAALSGFIVAMRKDSA